MSQRLRNSILQDLEIRADLSERFRLLGLYIQGVEVTQAIQYHNSDAHLTDAADQLPDNTIALIAGKPAWVRVYVRNFLHSDIPNVTGTIEVRRRQFFSHDTLGTLTPQPPGSVVAKHNPSYATERSTITDTLNFILPADFLCGYLQLIIRVHSDSGDEQVLTIDLDATLRQTLHLAGIMVGYNGPTSTAAGAPNVNIPAPTIANLQTTSAWTLLTFPISSSATFRSAGTVTWTLPLTDPPSCPGCCTPNWVALNSAVQTQRVADGNRTDVLYYGLMGAGIPMGPVIGCNSGGVSTGSNGDGVTMAHELGHACGLPHAPCNTPGDPNYPAYEPYDPAGTPQASIGEYGLDISNGNVMSPAVFKDLMSYCGPRWISLYNYGRLTNNTNLDPSRVCMPYAWWRDIVIYDRVLIPERWLPDPPPEDPFKIRQVMERVPLISIIGIVLSEKELEIKSVMRIDAVPEVKNAVPSRLTAELVDFEGKIISSAPVHRLSSHGSGCGCKGAHDDPAVTAYPYAFQAFVSNIGPGAGLRIREGENQIWQRPAPKSPPKITVFDASFVQTDRKPDDSYPERGGDQIVIEWGIRTESEAETEAWLQWSPDDGKNWYALATGLRPGKAELDVSTLPSGRVTLRLLASDGFHTAESEGVQVDIPKRIPSLTILNPRDGQTLVAGATMRLLGTATSSDGEPMSPKGTCWLIDDDVVAEDVLDTFIAAPDEGEHCLTLMMSSEDEEGEDSITIFTVRGPRQ